MMAEFFSQVDHWSWWILAVVLLVLEMFVPGTFFMWIGISAGVVGFLLLLIPSMGWVYQVGIFAVLSVVTVIAWRRYQLQHPVESDQPALNRRGEQYVGRTFTLEEAIVNGHGKIRVDDTTWRILGEDCVAGSRVKVMGVDGVLLKVELLP